MHCQPPNLSIKFKWLDGHPARNKTSTTYKNKPCIKGLLKRQLRSFEIQYLISAELSEAINSMFDWYHRSRVCYAYLSNIPPCTDVEQADSAFSKSLWFT